MDYYTEEKNNDILRFEGKWVDLESIKLSEITQPQKDKYHMYSLISAFRYKAKETSLHIAVPENLERT